MKYVFEIMQQYLKRNKKSAVILSLCIMLSVALIVIVLSFCITLVDIQACASYRLYSENTAITHEEIMQKVYSNDEYIANIGLGILLTLTSVLISVSSISAALEINRGNKAKIIAMLSLIGAEQKHCNALLISDALLLSVTAVPAGLFLGLVVSTYIVAYLNKFVIIPKGFNEVYLLGGNPVFWCVVIIIISIVALLLSCSKQVFGKSKISEIDIVKSYNAVDISLKPTILDKVFGKLFGYYGELASGNYHNHKKSFRKFSLSVSLSATLFISISSAFKYLASNLKSGDGKIIKSFELFFYIFVLSVFTITLISSVATLYASFLKRKYEFAILQSIGIEDKGIFKLVIIENVYYALYMLIFILIGGVIGNFIVFNILSSTNHTITFVYPYSEILISIFVVIVLTACISLMMTRITKTLNIADELKKSF